MFYAQDDAYSTAEVAIFQKVLAARGLTPITVQRTQLADNDFQTPITSTLQLNPQLVVLSVQAVAGGKLIRQLRELGYRGQIVVGNGLNTPNIYPICQRWCDGILIAQAFAAYQALFEAIQRLQRQGGLTGITLAQARANLMAELLSGTYDTPLGPIAFSPEGEVLQDRSYVAASGGVYALVALGYTLVFSLLGVINFAQGALFSVGGYLTCLLMGGKIGVNGAMPGWGLPAGLPFPLAQLLATAGSGLIGLLVERLQLLMGAEGYAFPPSADALAGGLIGVSVSLPGPYFGIGYGLKGLAVLVLGGLGSVPGAASGWRDALAFAILFAVLLLRPIGLLGRRTVEKV